MNTRVSAEPRIAPPLALALFGWLAGMLTLGLAPLRGGVGTPLHVVTVLLGVPGLLAAIALRLHSSWSSLASGIAAAFALGAGIAIPVAGATRAFGWPLENAGWLLAAIELGLLGTIAWHARRGHPDRLKGFDGLQSRGAAEWTADAFVLAAGCALAFTFDRWVEPAMRSGDLWYYLSYIDWMADRPGETYVPHTADPEEWNPRLQTSPFLALQATISRLVRVDGNPLQVFWSWLPVAFIPLALVMLYALAATLGAGPGVRIALVLAQLALLFATLPYTAERGTSGTRWPGPVVFYRTSQDKVFLALVLAPAVAAFAAEWLARGKRRWLVALLLTGLACVLTHPLGLPFFAAVTLPYAVLSGALRTASWRRIGALALLLLPLVAWPLSQRASEGVPNTIADDAGFARREHLTRDSLSIASREDNRYTANTSLVAHPVLVAGIASGLLLCGFARRRADARYAFATTAALLLMLYTPGIAPLAGLIVTPYLLWRFTWLLPVALSLAVLGGALAVSAQRRATRAGPVAAAGFVLVVALATALPRDLGRARENLGELLAAPFPADVASHLIEPLHERVGDETVLLDPELQTLAISLGAGMQTGYWRWGSNPALHQRVQAFFSSRFFARRDLELLRELDVQWLAVRRRMPIREEIERRSDLFEPVATIESIELFRVRGLEHATASRDALAYWRDRLQGEPSSPETLNGLAVALMASGERAGVVPALLASLEIDEANSATHELLGTAYMLERRYAPAIRQLERAVELDATRVVALNNLTWILATCPVARLRDPGAALGYAHQLTELGPPDAGSLDTIAAAQAAAGDFDSAVRHMRQVIDLYESAGSTGRALGGLRQRLASYQSGRAFVDVAD